MKYKPWLMLFGLCALTQVYAQSNPESGRVVVGGIDESMLPTVDNEGLSQDVSAMVIFSNDVFLKNAGYQFSQFRFRNRGYESRYEERYINGVSFNDQVRGVFNYSSIGALNDITREGDAINYFAPSAFSFGSIGGSENISMRAGSYLRGGKVTLSYTNRNYYARAMATYSTGLMDNGWAVTASVGGRYSHEGNIEGTFYRNIAYALGIEKRWDDDRHSLSLMTFGSPVERGQQGSSTQEVYDLRENNLYNPNWGYQNGKKRNSKVVRAFDPTAILSHVWKINEKNTLTTGVGAHYSRYGGTALNWYNGPDPRPDYYRYLPSYNQDNAEAFQYYDYLWRKKCGTCLVSQVNWDKLYEVNHLNTLEGDGSAIYMVEDRRKDLFEVAFNSTFNTEISEHLKITAGIGAKHSYSKQFKTVDDLLGAQYVLDVDKFAERDFVGDTEKLQNDLERPDRRAYKGDIFGYNFRFNINSANVWFHNEHSYRHWDFYYGAQLKYTAMQREGLMRNGRYPNDSFGKGAMHTFMDYGMKGGVTYKINGRHFLTGNISYQMQAPLVDKAYISPRIMDRTADQLKSVGVFAYDVNYIFSTPKLVGRISYFDTQFYDDMMRVSYYHDAERTFVNHTISGVRKSHRGVELGVNFKLNDTWNFDLIGTAADYKYANNPTGVISYENGKGEDRPETVYLNGYRLGGIPQMMGTFGINFFRDYWFVNLNINGFGRNFVEIAPVRHLASNYTEVLPPEANGFDQEKYDAYLMLTDQEEFKGGCTVDLGIGKIFYLKNRNSINFNLNISNLLNKKDVRTGGYEQGRLQLDNPGRFSSKYFYMQGINVYLNVSYRF